MENVMTLIPLWMEYRKEKLCCILQWTNPAGALFILYDFKQHKWHRNKHRNEHTSKICTFGISLLEA